MPGSEDRYHPFCYRYFDGERELSNYDSRIIITNETILTVVVDTKLHEKYMERKIYEKEDYD